MRRITARTSIWTNLSAAFNPPRPYYAARQNTRGVACRYNRHRHLNRYSQRHCRTAPFQMFFRMHMKTNARAAFGLPEANRFLWRSSDDRIVRCKMRTQSAVFLHLPLWGSRCKKEGNRALYVLPYQPHPTTM